MTPERLQDLLNAFVDDQLDGQGQRDLAKALETDEEARRAFVRATDQHQALRELMGRPEVQRTPTRIWIPLTVAAAAAILVALSFYFLRSETPAPPPENVAIKETKPTPPPRPTPPPPSPETTPQPPPKEPEPKPQPPPQPPTPPPTPKEPEKTPGPPEPQPEPPETPKLKPPTLAPTPKETAIAIATVESVRGKVFSLVAGAKKLVPAGQAIASGQGLETEDGSAAVIAFPDGSSVDLRPGTLLSEISAAAGKRIVLDQGAVYADVTKQPAGQPLVFSTRHAEAVVLGTKLALHCGEASSRLELKEGRVRFTRSEDKKGVDVVAGQYSIAGKGVDLSPKKITRGPMMAGAIWGEDFQEPEEIDKDWSLTRNGILVATRGQLDFDLTPGGTASLDTRARFAPPFRISVDVEFTQRLKGTLVGFRFQAKGKEFIHVDLDEDRYYLMVPEQTVTADVPRRTPRRERWTLDVAADGSVSFLVDFKQVLKVRRPGVIEEFYVILMTKANAKDVPPGAHVRFDNLLVEKPK